MSNTSPSQQYIRAFDSLAAVLQSIDERLTRIEATLQGLTAGNPSRLEPVTIGPDAWLTSKQVATMLTVSEWCLRNWRHLGTKGPKYTKLEGGFIRYRKADIDSWLVTQQRTPVNT